MMGYWIAGGFIVVLLLPNSMQWKERFKTNWFYLFMTLLFSMAIFFLYRKSEFIYFNF